MTDAETRPIVLCTERTASARLLSRRERGNTHFHASRHRGHRGSPSRRRGYESGCEINREAAITLPNKGKGDAPDFPRRARSLARMYSNVSLGSRREIEERGKLKLRRIDVELTADSEFLMRDRDGRLK